MTIQDYPLTQEYRFQKWSAATTLVIWSPRTNISGTTNNVVLTGLAMSSNLSNTFEIYLGTTTGAPPLMFQFTVGGSATVSPVMGPITTTLKGGIIYGKPAAPGSDGFSVVATGYEIE